MSPLKMAIASLVVGLIGLTASAMENLGSSSRPSGLPPLPPPKPKSEGLVMADVEKALGDSQTKIYKRRLRELDMYKYGYEHFTINGEKSSQSLPDKKKLIREIAKAEKIAWERKRREDKDRSRREKWIQAELITPQAEPQPAQAAREDQEDQWAELTREAQSSELAKVALAMVQAKPTS